jgi:HPt (histidine-containing phosphotransfer) domain-containing protein
MNIIDKQIINITDEDIKEILPGYLKKRAADMIKLEELFSSQNYLEIRVIAHNIKGTALSYGLEGFGEIAACLEDALKAKEVENASKYFHELKTYFEKLEIVYS